MVLTVVVEEDGASHAKHGGQQHADGGQRVGAAPERSAMVLSAALGGRARAAATRVVSLLVGGSVSIDGDRLIQHDNKYNGPVAVIWWKGSIGESLLALSSGFFFFLNVVNFTVNVINRIDVLVYYTKMCCLLYFILSFGLNDFQ